MYLPYKSCIFINLLRTIAHRQDPHEVHINSEVTLLLHNGKRKWKQQQQQRGRRKH